MSKDQAIGAAIFVVCLVIAIFYVATLFYPQWLGTLRIQTAQMNIQFWIVAIPVLIGFIGVLAIGAWIGYTMATTPPPKPVEEITAETKQNSTESS